MKLFACFLIFLPIFAIAQQKEKIVILSGKSANEMYNIAKEWFALSSNPGILTIQIDDPKEKKIIGKGVKNIVYSFQKSPAYVNVYYTLGMQFKDGRYKYYLNVITIKDEDGYEMSYVDFQSIATREGWNAYCKKEGIKTPFKSMVEVANFNNVFSLMNRNLDNIIADLTMHIKSEKTEIIW